MTSHSYLQKVPDHAKSYEYYFSSGYYDARYPSPNPNVLRKVLEYAKSSESTIIDFGCGSGRYALPLAGHRRHVVCFDISTQARDRLRENVTSAHLGDYVEILGGREADLQSYRDRKGTAEVLVALFGVLAHVEARDTRVRLLRWFQDLVVPEHGRIIVSVPNKRRRFRKNQKHQSTDNGEIVYTRNYKNRNMQFFYKLYDAHELRQEIEAAGLIVEEMRAESLLPESWIANSPALRLLERITVPWLPTTFGYGLLAVARTPARKSEAQEAPMRKIA